MHSDQWITLSTGSEFCTMAIGNEIIFNRSGLLKHSAAMHYYALKLMKYMKTIDNHRSNQPAAFKKLKQLDSFNPPIIALVSVHDEQNCNAIRLF